MLRISDLPIISLDLETGGLIPGKHTPLSIGAVAYPGDYSTEDDWSSHCARNSFYIQLEWDTMVVDPQAIRVNKLNIVDPPGPEGDFSDRSLPAAEGLLLFQQWLAQRYSSVHALGLNVGSFDLPMLRSIWQGPWPFHYRSIDLNSLFFALSQVLNKPFDVIKDEITGTAWEKSEFPIDMRHHALADAWSNIHMWEECIHRFCTAGIPLA